MFTKSSAEVLTVTHLDGAYQSSIAHGDKEHWSLILNQQHQAQPQDFLRSSQQLRKCLSFHVFTSLMYTLCFFQL